MPKLFNIFSLHKLVLVEAIESHDVNALGNLANTSVRMFQAAHFRIRRYSNANLAILDENSAIERQQDVDATTQANIDKALLRGHWAELATEDDTAFRIGIKGWRIVVVLEVTNFRGSM